jgi:hypothetical protein
MQLWAVVTPIVQFSSPGLSPNLFPARDLLERVLAMLQRHAERRAGGQWILLISWHTNRGPHGFALVEGGFGPGVDVDREGINIRPCGSSMENTTVVTRTTLRRQESIESTRVLYSAEGKP